MPRSRTLRLDRYWAVRLPLPVYFGVVTVLYGVLTWVFDAVGDHRHATLDELVLHVVIGSFFGAAMTAVVAVQRRRSGGPTRQIELARAIRSGAAPADADRATWAPLLERQIARMRRSRWLAPVLISPIVVFAIVGWALAPRAALPAAGLLVLSVGIIVLSEVQTARYLPRAGAVLEQVRSANGSPASRTVPDGTAAGRPRLVWAALALCAVAVIAVGTKVTGFFLSPGTVQTAIRGVQASDHLTAARAEQLASIAVALLLTYWAVLILAIAVFGGFAFAGRNWSRGWLVPTTLLALVQLVSPSPTSIVAVAALIVAVVLLYLPTSSAFVAEQGRIRSRAGGSSGRSAPMTSTNGTRSG